MGGSDEVFVELDVGQIWNWSKYDQTQEKWLLFGL